MTWWTSEEWLRYERACGCEGERARELATATWQTRVIDLSKTDEELFRDVRKSYRQLIARVEADKEVGVGTLPSDTFLLIAPKLHEQQAGRVTRSMASWEIQGEWIEQRRGYCFAAFRYHANPKVDLPSHLVALKPLAFIYIVVDGQWAYYFSGASLEPNLMHALQWVAILSLKEAGVVRYEIGWQEHATDEKGKAIEFFKRGFGGENVPARIVGSVQ